MNELLWIALGSALGGMLRYRVSGVVDRVCADPFPYGTMAVNVSGAIALGWLAAWLVPVDPAAWSGPSLLLTVGLLGSYTTMSSFSLQTLMLWHEGHAGRALLNAGLTLVLSIGAAAAGYAAGLAWGSA